MSVYPNVGLCHCRTPTGWNRTWLQSFLPPRPRRSRLWACSISSEPSAACALGRDIWYVLTVASRGLTSVRSNLDLLPLCLPFVDGSRFLAREHITIFDGLNSPSTRWRHDITNGRRMGLTWRRRRYSRTSPPDYLRTIVQALGPWTSTCSVIVLACRHSGGRG